MSVVEYKQHKVGRTSENVQAWGKQGPKMEMHRQKDKEGNFAAKKKYWTVKKDGREKYKIKNLE